MIALLKKRNMLSFVLVLLVCMAIAACAEKQKVTATSYSTLVTAAEAYDAGMHVLADLHKDGKITDEQKAEAIKYGNDFWLAYHTAVDALDAYYNSPDDGSAKTSMHSALSVLSITLGKFLEYSQAMGKGGTS